MKSTATDTGQGTMFSVLTEEELTTLYRMIRSGRNRVCTVMEASPHTRWADTLYPVVKDASATMTDLHTENQGR